MNIPNINLDESGKFIEQILTLPLKVNGEDKNIILKKLTAGERGQIRAKHVQTKIVGGQPVVKLNEAELEMALIHAAIKEAPFPHKLEDVKNFDSSLMDYLLTEYGEFSEPTDKKKE